MTVHQGDLGLDLALEMFSKKGLGQLFDTIEAGSFTLSHGLSNVLLHRAVYEHTVDEVIAFLQHRDYTPGYRIATRGYLPEGPKFGAVKDLSSYFGSIGIHDRARYFCTLYLEDLTDLIQATVGPHFEFSKYAERIAQTAVSFDPIREELERPNDYTDELLWTVLSRYFQEPLPMLVAFTVPFPGNLYGALKCAQWIRQHHPDVKIAMGGGYPNTELRELSDPGIFKYVDYICLDDGEGPLLTLLQSLKNGTGNDTLKRTYILHDGKVSFLDSNGAPDFSHSQKPAPDYSGLRLNDYLPMFDVPNPMHRLWNDGRWNKMTIAHGCYWKKCSFCDISLDYISRYDAAPATILVDQMEELVKQTGEKGFHFVDEAAPPLAMRDLALEILKRGLKVTWWTNIRFEKTFTPDLCKLLAASGCIAVTGGLEVASDRLLELMEKGITVEQVSHVCRGFRDAGIMVHAYLMYGFPTETAQETIDSLEVVRQLFENNLVQSAYWHRFAMTVHSPVGINPEKYQVVRTGPEFQGFANNDLWHEDPTGADHSTFSEGLKKALYNFMHQKGLQLPLDAYFHFKVPRTTLPKNLISQFLKKSSPDVMTPGEFILCWHEVKVLIPSRDELTGNAEVLFITTRSNIKIVMPAGVGRYIQENQDQFEASKGGVSLSHFAEQVEQRIGLTATHMMLEPWWKKWRREVVWRVRV